MLRSRRCGVCGIELDCCFIGCFITGSLDLDFASKSSLSCELDLDADLNFGCGIVDVIRICNPIIPA